MRKMLYAIAAAALLTALMLLAGVNTQEARADQLSPTFSSTDGSQCTDISDEDYFTSEYFDPGTEITLTSDTAIDSLYIRWEYIPGEWTLRINGNDYTYGKDGYLHEYVEIPDAEKGATSVTLVIGSERLTIADIFAFSEGTLPDFVQTWEASYDEADVLFISTHADDEVLFFGGLIATLVDKGDVRVQVAYFTDLFQTELYRNHEILNGLWAMGIRHYPQLGKFYDSYSESLEEAETQYDEDSSLEYIVETIRRFKPQVVVGQDVENGEYGHGGHMFCAKMIAEAVEITNDPEQYPDSASKYGTWDVPKTYFHLYPENQILLDLRVPLSSFGGRTAYQVACDAYLEHQSQQWCWFYVSDGYLEDGSVDEEHPEINCAKYGLYRTLVGADITGTDVMDNITTYDAQEKAEEEAAAAAAAAAAAEAETESTENIQADSVTEENDMTGVPGGRNTTALTILIVLAVILAIIIIGVIVVSRSRAKIREKERRINRDRNMRKREAAAGRAVQRSAYEYRPSRTSSSSASRSSAGSVRSGSGVRNTGYTSRSGYNSRTSNGSYNQDRTRNRQR